MNEEKKDTKVLDLLSKILEKLEAIGEAKRKEKEEDRKIFRRAMAEEKGRLEAQKLFK